MATNIEIEAKSMLKKEDYETLILAYKNIESYEQTNYYISSSELLSKIEKFGLRIRKKNRKYELTLKVTEEVGKREINQEITQKSLVKLIYFHKFPDGEIADFLSGNKICDITKLRILGKLETVRKDIDFNGSLISIDQSKYNAQIDYEIECESSSKEKAENDLKKFLDIHHISYQKSEHNKLARFLRTLPNL